MGLLERVSALLRANINHLIDEAEQPEKVMKQVILDMQNQLLQVKTQVAMAVADGHLLENKRKEQRDAEASYLRKAELALAKGREDLARVAAEQAINSRQLAEGFDQQLQDQNLQVENLKAALFQLENKLKEAQHRSELLMCQHRRARALGRAVDAKASFQDGSSSAALDRMKDKVQREQALSQSRAELETGNALSDELENLEKQERIDQVLAEIKQRKGAA